MNRIFRVFTLCFMLVMQWAFFGLARDKSILVGEVPTVEELRLSNNPKRLCGVASLYIALNVLNKKAVSLDQLLGEFPGIEQKGLSLRQLETYLERSGYYCLLKNIDERDIQKLGNGVVALVLSQTATDWHINVKYASPAGVRVVDPPTSAIVDSKNLSSVKQVSLLVKDSPFSIFEQMSVRKWILSFFAVLAPGLILIEVIGRIRRKKAGLLAGLFVITSQAWAGELGNLVLPDQVELGIAKVSDGSGQLNKVVVIRNSGSKSVRIRKVTASCSCLDMNVPGEIPAHGMVNASFKMTLKAGDFKGRAVNVVLETDEVGGGNYSMVFHGRSEPIAYAMPSKIWFDISSKNRKRIVYVYNPDSRHLDNVISDVVAAENMFLDARILKQWRIQDSNGGISYSAELELTYPLDERVDDSSIKIKCADGQEISVMISAS